MNRGEGFLTCTQGSPGRSTPEAGSRSGVLLPGTWWRGGMPKKGHRGEYMSAASYTRVGGRGRTHELSGLVPSKLSGPCASKEHHSAGHAAQTSSSTQFLQPLLTAE